MADRERIERVAAAIYAQMVTQADNKNPCSEDATRASWLAEIFIDQMDKLHPPEQPAAPTPDEPTLLEAAKDALRWFDTASSLRLGEVMDALRDAIAREEGRLQEIYDAEGRRSREEEDRRRG